MAFDKTVSGEQIEAILRKYSMEICAGDAFYRPLFPHQIYDTITESYLS